eukprot:352507-Chlamydomonas_euryale.AAC.5
MPSPNSAGRSSWSSPPTTTTSPHAAAHPTHAAAPGAHLLPKRERDHAVAHLLPKRERDHAGNLLLLWAEQHWEAQLLPIGRALHLAVHHRRLAGLGVRIARADGVHLDVCAACTRVRVAWCGRHLEWVC